MLARTINRFKLFYGRRFIFSPSMSGWRDDPILLDGDDEESSGSDLNDEQFELVKHRFNALRPRYASLWRELSSQNKENSQVCLSPENSVYLPSDTVVAACCGEVCSCVRTSVLPSSLLVDQDEKRSIQSSLNELDAVSEERPFTVAAEPFDSMNLVAGLAASIPDQDNDKDAAQTLTERSQQNSSPNSNLAETTRNSTEWIDSSSCRPLCAETSSGDPKSRNSLKNEDVSDGESSTSESSAASTVLQWDSWSDSKNARPHADSNLPTSTNNSPQVLFRSGAGGTGGTNIESGDAKVLTPPASAGPVRDEVRQNSSIDTQSEVEWDGSLDNIQPFSSRSDMEDLIQKTETIDILDNSEDDITEDEISIPDQENSRRVTQKRSFGKVRQDLADRFFKEFDERLCQGRLAESTTIKWSSTLRKTAGLTRLRKVGDKRTASIELATKVLDDEQRLRSTLLHEICHAAAFVLDGVSKPPHGECFRKWARRAMRRIPDIEVTTTHDYIIQYSHFWTCTNCAYVYKRHSRSIDIVKHRCGRCQGILFVSHEDGTPKATRAPSAYQLFIQENSAAVRTKLRRKHSSVSPAEVMRECARMWREQKAHRD